ncbi:MAG: ArsR/SmtB family transcription factor [Minisyncoccia bacterium]
MKENLKELEVILKGLANIKRLKILNYLNKSGERDTADIADYLNINYKLAIPHLERLIKAKLVTKRRDGLIVNYRITNLGKRVLKILKHLKI